MAWTVEPLAALLARARAAFRAYLPGTDAWLWPNNVYVIAKVLAGSSEELQGRIAYVAKQSRPLTATGADLVEWGTQYGLPPKPASAAGGTVLITTPDALAVPAGTLLLRSDGIGYAVASDAAAPAAGTVPVAVLALATGKAALADPGTPLVLATGPAGQAASGPGLSGATAAVGDTGLVGGADVENLQDEEAYRDRILFRLRNPPHGGAPSDYVIWAGQVPGVTRTFVERLPDGPGTVRVYPLFDDVFAGTGGVADTAHVAAVIDALAPLVPAGADWSVAAPKARIVDVVVAGLQPMTTAVQNAVRAELADTVRRLGRVAGTDTPVAALPFLATPFTFSRSWISQAVANATGEARHDLLLPAENEIVVPAGSIPVLGTVTFS